MPDAERRRGAGTGAVRARRPVARPVGRSAPGLPVPQLVRARRAVGTDDCWVVRGVRSRWCLCVRESDWRAEVHVSADYGPYGRERDAAVAERVDLVTTGSPYAVAPGRVTRTTAAPTRCSRRGSSAGSTTAGAGRRVRVRTHSTGSTRRRRMSRRRATQFGPRGFGPAAGEAAALERWSAFVTTNLIRYDAERDRPDLDTTSRMSVYLKFGNIHPRTMLADLARKRSHGAEQYRRAVAWRDFYADILFPASDSARRTTTPSSTPCVTTPTRRRRVVAAWCEGRPAFRSSTPGFGSWCPRGGCTTACG